jgi:hypothetical protein
MHLPLGPGLKALQSLSPLEAKPGQKMGALPGAPPLSSRNHGRLWLYWLVVWNMNFIFHFIYGMSSFPLTKSIIFQDGYGTTNQIGWRYNGYILLIIAIMIIHY